VALLQGEALATCPEKLGFKITATSRTNPLADWSDGPHRDLYFGDMKFAARAQLGLVTDRKGALSHSPS
jgi:hypothetical protein